jgi:acyl-CoA dehydrogenase
MHNFNHERIYVSIAALRLSRICLEESLVYVCRRRAFGAPLSNMQALQIIIAEMAGRCEMFQALLDKIVHQMDAMPHERAQQQCGDIVAILKAEAGDLYEFCANRATQCFGGNALAIDGVGKRIESSLLSTKGYSVPAGATLVMRSFAGRANFARAHKESKPLAKL